MSSRNLAVHPSNFGQLIIAHFFIDKLNQHYGAAIPQIDGDTFGSILLTDPFIDKDNDGRVPGRFGAGLLERSRYCWVSQAIPLTCFPLRAPSRSRRPRHGAPD